MQRGCSLVLDSRNRGQHLAITAEGRFCCKTAVHLPTHCAGEATSRMLGLHREPQSIHSVLISLKTKETPCCLETAGPGGQTLPALLAKRFSALHLCGLPRHRAGGCCRARGLGKAWGWRGAAAALVKATPRPELRGTKPPRREIRHPKGRTLHAAAKCIPTTAPLLAHPARCTEPPLADHPGWHRRAALQQRGCDPDWAHPALPGLVCSSAAFLTPGLQRGRAPSVYI